MPETRQFSLQMPHRTVWEQFLGRPSRMGGSLRLIAYVSKALKETEEHYAQIEKEALAVI